MLETEEAARHPFLQGLSKHRGAPPTIIVIFGASGDLTKRKLIPALYNLGLDSLLPRDFFLIGYGRRPIPDEEFRQDGEDSLKKFSRRPLNTELWSHVEPNMSYHAGGYDELTAFAELREKMLGIEKELGRNVQFLFYISTPPSVFKPILENLGASGLAKHGEGTDLASKVIIEKPFGRDLASAQELNRIITNHVD